MSVGYGHFKDAIYVATLINPRNHKPYVVVWAKKWMKNSYGDSYKESDCVLVTSPDTYDAKKGTFEALGAGTYETYGGYGSDYERSQKATGCPRTHAVKGVSEKGVGLGLMLYCGLCLTVGFASEMDGEERREWELDSLVDSLSASKPCISSSGAENGGRSSEADKFWNSQKGQKYKDSGTGGLVEEVEGEGEEESSSECDVENEDVSIDADDIGYDDARARKLVKRRKRNLYIDDIEIQEISVGGSVEVEVRYCIPGEGGGSATYDVMRVAKVMATPLILHCATELSRFSDHGATPFGSDVSKAKAKKLFEEMDLSGITNKPFLKLMEEVAGEIDLTGAEYTKFLRERIPFYAGDYEKAKAGGFVANPGLDRAEMLKIAKSYRNAGKKAYALALVDHLTKGTAEPNKQTFGLGYMGAQAVHMDIGYPGEGVKKNPAKPVHSKEWLAVFGPYMDD